MQIEVFVQIILQRFQSIFETETANNVWEIIWIAEYNLDHITVC